MGGSNTDRTGGGGTCEECGADGAQLLEVSYGDENVKTFDLCEDCLTGFQGAELVDEMSLIEEPDRSSTE